MFFHDIRSTRSGTPMVLNPLKAFAIAFAWVVLQFCANLRNSAKFDAEFEKMMFFSDRI